MEFKNKVFVVTGGGNGIGREVVLKLLSKEAIVAALDISQNGLDETKALAGEMARNLSLHIIDVTNKEQIDNLPKTVLDTHKGVDAVLNVAGIIQPFIPVNDLDYTQIERVMNVNFYGPLYLIKAFLPHLLKKETQTYIANVSSMGAFLPVPGQSVYGASKAALKLLTEGLYAELKETNVKVSIIMPGAIETNIVQNSDVKLETNDKAKKYKALSASKAGDIILDGIAKNKLRIVVGPDAKFMDFLSRKFPKFSIDFITKKMNDLMKK